MSQELGGWCVCTMLLGWDHNEQPHLQSSQKLKRGQASAAYVLFGLEKRELNLETFLLSEMFNTWPLESVEYL